MPSVLIHSLPVVSKRLGLVCLLMLCMVLSACETSAFYHQSPDRHVVVLEGQRMSVLKLEDGSWEVAGGYETWQEQAADFKGRQIKAIELVSGCTVLLTSQTAYPAKGSTPERLVAQVTCDTTSAPILPTPQQLSR